MNQREMQEQPGEGPFDRPERDAGDPIGDNAYPGGDTMTPPTGDMDDPIPETGMPGERELETVGPEVDERP